jgi:hypothetical protein
MIKFTFAFFCLLPFACALFLSFAFCLRTFAFAKAKESYACASCAKAKVHKEKCTRYVKLLFIGIIATFAFAKAKGKRNTKISRYIKNI